MKLIKRIRIIFYRGLHFIKIFQTVKSEEIFKEKLQTFCKVLKV